MLQFAAAVWNAVVLRDIRGAFTYLATRMPPRLRVPPSKQWDAIRDCSRASMATSISTTTSSPAWGSNSMAPSCTSRRSASVQTRAAVGLRWQLEIIR